MVRTPNTYTHNSDGPTPWQRTFYAKALLAVPGFSSMGGPSVGATTESELRSRLQTVLKMVRDLLPPHQAERVNTTLTIGVSPLAGYSVDPEALAAIILTAETTSIASQYFQPVEMLGAKAPIPWTSTPFSGEVVGEGVKFTPADVVFSQLELLAKKILAVLIMSRELGEDTDVAIIDALLRRAGSQLGILRDYLAFCGPTGMIASASNVVTMDAGETSFEYLQIDHILRTRLAIDWTKRQRSKVFISEREFLTIAKKQGRDGQPLLNLLASGPEIYLAGIPFVITPTLEGIADAADTKFVVCGNPEMMLFGRRKELTFSMSGKGILDNGAGIILNALQADSLIGSVSEKVAFGCLDGSCSSVLKTAAA